MLAEVLEREAVAPEDKDIRAVTEVDVQEGGHGNRRKGNHGSSSQKEERWSCTGQD